jgi:UDPglucose 6-dehydrogenase
LNYVEDTFETLRDAEAVLLLTEWSQYRELQPEALAEVTTGRIVIDGRNVLDPARWRAAGWTYVGLGRR